LQCPEEEKDNPETGPGEPLGIGPANPPSGPQPWIPKNQDELDRVNDTLDHITNNTIPSWSKNPKKWGSDFRNDKLDLPSFEKYKEYDVQDPTVTNRGSMRVVKGETSGTLYLTSTHYGDNGPPAFEVILGGLNDQ
jgi:hypothetical protein